MGHKTYSFKKWATLENELIFYVLKKFWQEIVVRKKLGIEFLSEIKEMMIVP